MNGGLDVDVESNIVSNIEDGSIVISFTSNDGNTSQITIEKDGDSSAFGTCGKYKGEIS